MEMEIDGASVVAAHRAATAGFFHEQPLQLLFATGYGFADASLAAPSLPTRTTELVVELDPAVVLTEADLCSAVR